MRKGMSYSDAGKLGYIKSKAYWDKKHKKIRDDYYKKPNLCKFCHSIIAYEKRGCLFCGHSCAAAFNNKGVRRHGVAPSLCPVCNKKLSSSIKKCCNHKCASQYKWQQLKIKIEKGEYKISGPGNPVLIKYMIETKGRKCEQCGLAEWQCKPIPLNVHHKDGDAGNNLPSNIQFLCLNCHGLTKNYGRRNKFCTRKCRKHNAGMGER